MGKMSSGCFTCFKDHRKLHESQKSEDLNIANSSLVSNIIQNHDFSNGLHSWSTNCCDGIVVSPEVGTSTVQAPKPCNRYAVISNRKESWQGLEQDITTRVSSGLTYTLYARVGVSGAHLQGHNDVIATLKLEYHGSETKYMSITRTSVSKERWENLEGTFVLSDKPDRVVFYLEGPAPGVNLLIESVVVSCASSDKSEDLNIANSSLVSNIIQNHDFSNGLHSWSTNCCDGIVVSPEVGTSTVQAPKPCNRYAVISNRKESWQGLEQDITTRVSSGLTYTLYARVGVSGAHLQGHNDVIATLKLEYHGSETKYMSITRTSVSKERWENLEGTFVLSDKPDRVVFYLEGPAPGVNLLIESVVVSCASSDKSEDLNIANSSLVSNIIQNHDFSNGLHSWSTNCCDGIVVSPEVGTSTVQAPKPCNRYAVISNRKESWQGLEQDITTRVSSGLTYTLYARVGVSGAHLQGHNDVIATLKLEYHGSETKYMSITRTSVSKERWENLEGTFVLSDKPDRVVFYLEGPAPGVNLLIESVVVSCASSDKSEDLNIANSSLVSNIIQNHDFSNGLHSWSTNCCDGIVVSPEVGTSTVQAPKPCNRYAVISNRKESWQGLEQDITTRVSSGLTYTLYARVGVSGAHLQGHNDVIATLKLEYHGSETKYISITRTSVSKERWENLEGTFVLSDKPDRVVFYLEGPAPGVNLLIESVVVSCASSDGTIERCIFAKDENILWNPNFEDGVNNWSGRGCKIAIHDSMGDGKILPKSGNFFASATQRAHSWNGIQQDISGRVQRKIAYNVIARVRIFGNNVTSADVRVTLWVQTSDYREQYIGIAKAHATDNEWVQLQGKFLLNGSPSKVVIYLEGPLPGVDILLDGLVVHHAEKIPPSPPPVIEDADYGVNIITNGNLGDGTNGWAPLGNCTLRVAAGSPHLLPSAARDTFGLHEPQSGHCIHATNRTHTWMGPSQTITDKIKLFVTYQVSAWVRLVHGATGPQNVSVALGVDSEWVNGGQVEINDDKWHEIRGSFRIEKQPGKVMAYVQGPAPGISFMVAGFQIFAVDRRARFGQLKQQTDKIRKRDVTLKFSSSDSSSMHGTRVIIKQIHNSFPIGSCISRENIDNEDFVAFFLKNFNWAVFGNELKWYWTESQRGNYNYKDADELLKFCDDNNIAARGHCIFWEVEDTVQHWVKSLGKNELAMAVENRLNSLLNRYKGRFKHHDVNNEMLHGSFYQDRLGKDARANMFKTAKRLDPSATLFVNDYHVEDGHDTRSSPEKYLEQILDLEEQGASVGGIGIQGHIESPVGSIVCSALDKLGVAGLPIWFTELDVSSTNEHVRADDLEVMMREAYAHPGVEGIMLWGFWELFMSRENCHLVNAEGEVNEAGIRFLELKKEWLSHADGHVDERSEFVFRGFEGTYEAEVFTLGKKIVKTFVVEKADPRVVVSIEL